MSDIFKSLTIDDVDFLNNEKTLYSIDFRATGESLDKNIDAMFKYENNTRWLSQVGSTKKRHIVVNETLLKPDCTALIIHLAPRLIKTSHTSVYRRIKSFSRGLDTLWVGVPHPDADELAATQGLKLNYTYKSFLERNDKISQKRLLGNLTPDWTEFRDEIEFKLTLQTNHTGFLKKRLGAGGYNVIDLGVATTELIENTVQGTSYDDWYIEERALGKPMSVQCVTNTQGTTTVFGVSEQHMESGTIYVGAKINDVATLSNNMRNQIEEALVKIAPLLDGYVGFFGIDFMVNEDRIAVLEFNVRLTAASIPTLLRNNMGEATTGLYLEDKDMSATTSSDIILTTDNIHHANDVISF